MPQSTISNRPSVLEDRHVATDLLDAAQRHDAQRSVGQGRGQLQSIVAHVVRLASWAGFPLGAVPTGGSTRRYGRRMTTLALDDSTIKNTAIGIIIGVIILGIIMSLVIQAIVGRIIVIVLALVVAFVVYKQRDNLEQRVKNCDTNLSFFGFHVQTSDSVKQACATAKR